MVSDMMLVLLVCLTSVPAINGMKITKACPRVCEPEKCPNIGPISLSACPKPYIVYDRCNCCRRCDIQHVTTTVPPSRRSEVCQKFKCPKKKLCTLNMQGLPTCKCPSDELCRRITSRKYIKKVKVCGSDGVTYPTRCHLKVASCKSSRKIRAVHRGDCRTAKLPAITTIRPSTSESMSTWFKKFGKPRKGRRRDERRQNKRRKRKNKKKRERFNREPRW